MRARLGAGAVAALAAIAFATWTAQHTGDARPTTAQPATAGPNAHLPGPLASGSAGPAEPRFHAVTSILDEAMRASMGWSWRPGCPVPLDELRLVTVDRWGFDGRIHPGRIVVNARVTGDVVRVFSALFDARFPIERMEPVDAYRGDDDRSMAADNTSGFNCREATGHPGVWSQHAYGLAIDVNPLRNPYVAVSGTVSPPAGAPFADRARHAPGMIHAGDAVVRAFDAVGWLWGGSWTSVKDYQHFSVNGR